MFSKRNQKQSETVEDYAAELKRLYDKAHPGREDKTRREDLLRRFLDGIADREASSQVEFICKSLKDIDQAVEEVINYQQLHKKARGCRIQDENESSDEEDIRYAGRGPGRPKNKRNFEPFGPNNQQQQNTSQTNGTSQGNGNGTSGLPSQSQNVGDIPAVPQYNAHQGNQNQNVGLQNFNLQGPNQNYNMPAQNSYNQGYNRNYSPRPPPTCYRCNELGHTSKNCTAILMLYTGNPAQLNPQMATQLAQMQTQNHGQPVLSMPQSQNQNHPVQSQNTTGQQQSWGTNVQEGNGLQNSVNSTTDNVKPGSNSQGTAQ